MDKYQEVEGDLIKLALLGQFDVVAHGCNCFCRMKRGIAPQMAKAFGCSLFELERTHKIVYYDDQDYEERPTNNEGDINKLGQIDYETKYIWEKHPKDGLPRVMNHMTVGQKGVKKLIVVNCYTQYYWGTNLKPFDYEAFILCMRKMNRIFKDKHIGLPQIGSHLAGGDWEIIKQIIQKELKDCYVTIVIYKP